jgi:hypothetical protein
MADDLDVAQQITDFFTETAIEQAKQSSPKPTGLCLNCHALLQPTEVYCDKECAEDHEKRARLALRG